MKTNENYFELNTDNSTRSTVNYYYGNLMCSKYVLVTLLISRQRAVHVPPQPIFRTSSFLDADFPPFLVRTRIHRWLN
jgi:hypothetical protein